MSITKNESTLWRRILWWVNTVVLTVVTASIGLVSLVFSPLGAGVGSRESTSSGMEIFGVLFAFLAIFALAAMVWSRRRWPFEYTIAGSIAGLLFPVSPVFALVGFAELIARGKTTKIAIGSVATVAVVLRSVIGDVIAPSREQSFLQVLLSNTEDGDERVAIPVYTVILVVLILLAIPVGIGLLLRFQRGERIAVQQRDQLGGELGRSHERERIAHEIHDVLGHRLSQLSLRASALEAKAAQYPEISEEATQMRQSAAQSMDDLRSLLRVIQGESNEVSLSEIHEVIRETGIDERALNLTVYLRDADDAPGEIARAVIRIVQEIITNARKYAPGKLLRLTVSGGPGEGITIASANELGSVAAGSAGTGSGLSGMQERVRLLGGQFSAGQIGRDFRVDVHIQWPEHA
ncbi:sensor histidine kinase [Gulosibacter molinativorax]|uniref:histidine kinase n=1 Tax=Gulosibacter molinativorax TaxID=256821 RepID=A0ABT7CBX4_9MICO|nr:histidine kinase [Gulosibacter molinativorax]MDJ1372252.1 two-component sensor histidine kinase [Gulosibacter molinativorax]QUY63464.1 Hypotetical protein [Gulosibacter molinativorax]